MRLFSLILLSIVGLSPITGYTATLVGDWLQDDPDESSINERQAISQPVTQSTETTRVTLGIKSPGTTDLVDFFLIISGKSANSGCQHSAEEVIIDSKSFPVSSATNFSNISGIKTGTADEQKQIWKAFRKGQKLSLKIRQICNVENVPNSEINTFDFSLKGSSAAYRFVIGEKIIASQNKEKVTDTATTDVAEPEDSKIYPEDESEDSRINLEDESEESSINLESESEGTRITVEDESNETSFIPWLLALLVVVLLITWFLRQYLREFKPGSIMSTLVSGSAKSVRQIRDYLREKASIDTAMGGFQLSPETREPFISDLEPDIADLPRFGIDHEFQQPPEPSEPFISNPNQTITKLPQYKVEHVIDGDTAVVSSFARKHRIRLDAIDCPEDGQEWGDIATAGLIDLIGGKHVHLEEHGTDSYERMLATLYVNQETESEWINVNERMVTLGHAWVMREYYKHLPKHRQDKLNKLESWAKSKKVGLWKTPDPVPPWEWRNEVEE